MLVLPQKAICTKREKAIHTKRALRLMQSLLVPFLVNHPLTIGNVTMTGRRRRHLLEIMLRKYPTSLVK